MKRQSILIALGLVAALAPAAYGLYQFGHQQGSAASAAGHGAAPTKTASGAVTAVPQTIAQGEAATRRHVTAGIKAGDLDPEVGLKVLFYQDPMSPTQKFDKPGKSPFMDMMLVPVYAESGGDADKPGAADKSGAPSGVTVSARTQQSLGVRTAVVTEGRVAPQVSAVGAIAFNERDQAVVQTRASGFVERLHVRATLDRVAKGQPLADLFVPEWLATQEEFLAVRRMQGTISTANVAANISGAGAMPASDLAALLDAARQRMRQAGMAEALIQLVESSAKPQPRITLSAPIGGVLVELSAREGMTVMPGTTLFRINGLGSVWAEAQVHESQSALIRPGSKVLASSAAAPETVLRGTVQAIVPEVNPATRTLRARVELPNPGARLVPGMLVNMQFVDLSVSKQLLVPTEALIQTGKRTVVIVAEDNGRFRPVEVRIGLESNGQTAVTQGLQSGQKVVVSAQFLIDSEASLKGVEARLNAIDASTKPIDASVNQAQGAKP